MGIHQGMTTRKPMVGFEFPTSSDVAREIVPPEVEDVALLLSTAFEVVPEVRRGPRARRRDGMRRGELVGIRASSLQCDKRQLHITTAVSGKRVKPTKTRTERAVSLDGETAAMLARILEHRRGVAAFVGVPLVDDPYLFSHAADSSTPMPRDFLTSRVAVSKGHLGIENKQPATVAGRGRCAPSVPGRRRPATEGQDGSEAEGRDNPRRDRRATRSKRALGLAGCGAAERREAVGALAHRFDGPSWR